MSKFVNDLFNLNDKVAVITGAGGHLCSEMAKGLAKSGCDVVVLDIRKEKADKIAKEISDNIGVKAISVQADAGDKLQIENGLNTILKYFKKVDILINGAGINSPTPFLEIEIDEFQKVLNTQK